MSTIESSKTEYAVSGRRRMTLAQFDALPPDETVDRELINGELWEERAVTYRNRWHAGCEGNLSYLLNKWIFEVSDGQFQLFAGDVGVQLPDLENRFGLDLAVFTKDAIAALADSQNLITGVPVLAIEIHSPSDTLERMRKKREQYLENGVPIVWSVDPFDKSVTVYQPDVDPQFFVGEDHLRGFGMLPDLDIPLKSIFQ